MPKRNTLPSPDIAMDLSHVEESFRQIDDPHMRYLIAQVVDLIAEDAAALNERAESMSGRDTAEAGKLPAPAGKRTGVRVTAVSDGMLSG